MKLIIAGTRTIDDAFILERAMTMAKIDPKQVSVVISGACGRNEGDATFAEGVDGLGEAWADAHGIPVHRFYAKWKEQGNSAGPRRNERMAKEGTHLLAIWDEHSDGTRDMIIKAAKNGIKVFVYQVTSGTSYGWLSPRLKVLKNA